jgi:hypothetical protein
MNYNPIDREYSFFFTETENSIYIYKEKIASRFMLNFLKNINNTPIEIHTPDFINYHLTDDNNKSTTNEYNINLLNRFLEVIEYGKTEKPIVILYRNPFEKFFSGIIQDFQPHFLRDLHEEWEFKELEILESLLEFKDNKKVLDLFFEENGEFESYISVFDRFLKNETYRGHHLKNVLKDYIRALLIMNTNVRRIDIGHAGFWCWIVNELLFKIKTKNIKLIDIDSHDGNYLKSFMEKSESIIDKNENHHGDMWEFNGKLNSNQKLKELCYDIIRNDDEIKENIENLLKFEYYYYQKIKKFGK